MQNTLKRPFLQRSVLLFFFAFGFFSTVDSFAVPPAIIDAVVNSDNSVTITFSEGVYTDPGMSGALVPGDFKLFFIRGRGTATGATILSVAHTAGDSTLTLTLDITGTPNGNETVEFRAFPGEIFNASGEAASSSTTTGKLELNDRILTSLEGTLEEKQVVIRNNIINSKRGEEARITYNVERSTRVTISIHDLNGDLIKVLFDGTSMPGLNEVLWAGENKKGRSVVGGVYYIVIKIGDTRDVKKILVAW